MALINCPECGKEISDQSDSCIHCGYLLRPIISSPKRKRSPLLIAIIVSIIAVLLAVPVFVLYKTVWIPKGEYDQAIQALESGEYDAAIDALTEIGDYKDSDQKIKEAYYRKGIAFLEQKQYDAALEAMKLSDGYEDSMEQIIKIESIITERDELLKKEERLQNLKSKLISAKGQCLSSRTYLSNDGLSIVVDGQDKDDVVAFLDVYTIVDVLGLPDSLVDEMAGTSAIMGKQSESFEDYDVSWSYHPDNGLDAYFKIKEK